MANNITVLLSNGKEITYPATALNDRASDLWADLRRRETHTASRFAEFAIRIGNVEKAARHAQEAAQAGRCLLAIERTQRMRARKIAAKEAATK